MADWQIAAISAGSALLGAVIGGASQLLLQRRDHREARREAQRARRRSRYSELIHLFMHLPDLLYDAAVAGSADGYQLIRQEFGRKYDTLRAEMMLVGSRDVRSKMNNAREAVQQAFRVWSETSSDDLHKPRDERLGFDVTLRAAFDDYVLPSLHELANVMTKELDED